MSDKVLKARPQIIPVLKHLANKILALWGNIRNIISQLEYILSDLRYGISIKGMSP